VTALLDELRALARKSAGESDRHTPRPLSKEEQFRSRAQKEANKGLYGPVPDNRAAQFPFFRDRSLSATPPTPRVLSPACRCSLSVFGYPRPRLRCLAFGWSLPQPLSQHNRLQLFVRWRHRFGRTWRHRPLRVERLTTHARLHSDGRDRRRSRALRVRTRRHRNKFLGV
jgi:hypothetical protein